MTPEAATAVETAETTAATDVLEPAAETPEPLEQPEATEDAAVTVSPVAFSPLEGAAAASADAGPRPLDLLLDVAVPITVELGHTVMPIEELLALKPGSILELDRLASEPVDLLIRDRVIAHGEIIVLDDAFGLRITHILDPADRLTSLGAAERRDEGRGTRDEDEGRQDGPEGAD